jgi:hypothetical protein
MRIEARTLSNIYFAGLLLLCIGLPLSKFLMSVSQFLLAASWLLDLNYKKKWQQFTQNKLAMVLTGVFVLHLIGLLYSSDLRAGWSDVRIKIPLLVLPFIFSTSPRLSPQRFYLLMGIFVASVLISTGCSIAVLLGYTRHVVNDIRDISIFISHIRLSLLICIAIFTVLFAIFNKPNATTALQKLLLFILVFWFLAFLFILESITGITIFFIVGLILTAYFIFKQKKRSIKLILVILLLGVPGLAYFFIKKTVHDFYVVQYVDTERLPQCSPYGNAYEYKLDNFEMENGNRIYLYLCKTEMQQEWRKRSIMPFEGKDHRNQDLEYTLIRFLTSKGLRKDADGIRQLSENEIRSIENGIANVNYQDISNIRARLNQLVWEYYILKLTGNPSGHSVTQRFEFWKASLNSIKSHVFTGVGTGDVEKSYHAEYEKMKSPLAERWRLHAHNQFLSIFVAFGVFGFIYFVFSLLYPLYTRLRKPDYFYVVFWCIAVISMLTEDTLETQAGATFFAFFNALFLFAKPQAPYPDEAA